jgi:hypothetical protein
MMSFETIDIFALEHVTGGADEGGPNRDDVNIGINADRRRINIGVQGSRSRTDYGLCVQETRAAGGTPRDIRDTCGLPPAK